MFSQTKKSTLLTTKSVGETIRPVKARLLKKTTDHVAYMEMWITRALLRATWGNQAPRRGTFPKQARWCKRDSNWRRTVQHWHSIEGERTTKTPEEYNRDDRVMSRAYVHASTHVRDVNASNEGDDNTLKRWDCEHLNPIEKDEKTFYEEGKNTI